MNDPSPKIKFKKSKFTEEAPLKKHTIMIVDDEKGNLETLSMLLEPHYNVLSASDGLQALEMIKALQDPEGIQLILSDQRMPNMDGVTFLKESISLIPRAIRMILTGYTDVNNIISAINESRIYKLFTKPIEPNVLLVSIQRAIEAYELEEENRNLLMKLKSVNEKLEFLVQERTAQLEESLKMTKTQKEELEYLSNFQDTLVAELQLLSITDPLTGLANRRWLESYADTEWKRGIRGNLPFSILMIDIDFFKLYNDHYGHALGDKCIKLVAEKVKSAMKYESDFAVRYGGEEFCCILPETDLDRAIGIANEIRILVEQEKISHKFSKVSDQISLSIGIASTTPEENSHWKDLLKIADTKLYDAKNSGRNQIQY